MSQDRYVLACHRVEDLDVQNPLSERGHFCSTCNSEVWVMTKNLGYGLVILCLQCSAIELAKQETAGEKAFVLPASEIPRRN